MQLFKLVQLAALLGRLFRPLMKVGFSLMQNILVALDKSVLIPLGLTAAASVTDARNLK